MYNVLDKNSRVAQLWLGALYVKVSSSTVPLLSSTEQNTKFTFVYYRFLSYSQLSPCGHLAIMDTPITRIAAKYQAKINYRRSTEINSHYYGHSLMRTLTRGPTVSSIKGVDCIIDKLFLR